MLTMFNLKKEEKWLLLTYTLHLVPGKHSYAPCFNKRWKCNHISVYLSWLNHLIITELLSTCERELSCIQSKETGSKRKAASSPLTSSNLLSLSLVRSSGSSAPSEDDMQSTLSSIMAPCVFPFKLFSFWHFSF